MKCPRNRHPLECIPLFAVGYIGWKFKETVKNKLLSAQDVYAIIDPDIEYDCT